MSQTVSIGLTDLSIEQIAEILYTDTKIALRPEAEAAVVKCRTYLDEKMAKSDKPFYGINTGFGSLYNIKVEADQLGQLQENLVKSHACGMGDEAPADIVRLMLLLKVQNMAYGHSAVQLETVNRLITFYNEDCLPVVYQLGSLGASGDLAPLAHLSLALLGMGEVDLKGERMPAADALNSLGLEPIRLKSKEGLALLNGTQFMSAYAIWSLIESYKLNYLADVIGSISLEAYDGRIEAFDHKFIKLGRMPAKSEQLKMCVHF